jgi:lantibiotic biosynthesis protein
MTTSSDYLDVAASLARRLAGSAVWHEKRCNWVGVAPRDPSQVGGLALVEALGPSLYDGTAGVALFLAEAAAALDDDARLREVAQGALRHALHHAHKAGGDGLHSGVAGIAYAAARVAIVLGCDETRGGACELLGAWRRRRAAATAWDLTGGCAGTVSGLVALSDMLEDVSLLELAVTAGEELLAAAERTDSGWLWPNPSRPSEHGLCGFAHGAAGIGQALVELWAATGEPRFRDAAAAAFDYERSWFAGRDGTWPDLRGAERRAGRDVPAPVSDTWCQGAPGIALSRLRAAALLRSDALHADAETALALTRRHVAELSFLAPDDFSLCHGAAGAADVLLYGTGDSGLVRRIGDIGRERHHLASTGFPCGVPHGETPGLLIGVAGIGLFYLRLWDPRIDTVLVVHRNSLDSVQPPSLESAVTYNGQAGERGRQQRR